jgi:hypothetical protein
MPHDEVENLLRQFQDRKGAFVGAVRGDVVNDLPGDIDVVWRAGIKQYSGRSETSGGCSPGATGKTTIPLEKDRKTLVHLVRERTLLGSLLLLAAVVRRGIFALSDRRSTVVRHQPEVFDGVVAVLDGVDYRANPCKTEVVAV